MHNGEVRLAVPSTDDGDETEDVTIDIPQGLFKSKPDCRVNVYLSNMGLMENCGAINMKCPPTNAYD